MPPCGAGRRREKEVSAVKDDGDDERHDVLCTGPCRKCC